MPTVDYALLGPISKLFGGLVFLPCSLVLPVLLTKSANESAPCPPGWAADPFMRTGCTSPVRAMKGAAAVQVFMHIFLIRLHAELILLSWKNTTYSSKAYHLSMIYNEVIMIVLSLVVLDGSTVAEWGPL